VDLDAPDTLARLDAAGVDHAFVGEVAIRNDRAGSGQGLVERLEASPNWRSIHASGEARVYMRDAAGKGG
jgi:hypothetical protein